MADETPGRVAATLSAMQDRLDDLDAIRLRRHIMAEESVNLKLHAITEDFCRLLAAAEAALKLADEARPGFSAACTCYDCEAAGAGDPGYDDYEMHSGRPLAWNLDPAKLREAITAALTGEEAGDGQ